MRIWIDATRPESRLEIFSMSLLERQLRPFALAEEKVSALKSGVQQAGLGAARDQFVQLAHSHTIASEIWVELPEGDPTPDWIPQSLLEKLPIHWKTEAGSTSERLQRGLRDADGETVIALSGDTVIDQRIVEQLAWWAKGSVAFVSDEGEKSAAAIRIRTSTARWRHRCKRPGRDRAECHHGRLRRADGSREGRSVHQETASPPASVRGPRERRSNVCGNGAIPVRIELQGLDRLHDEVGLPAPGLANAAAADPETRRAERRHIRGHRVLLRFGPVLRVRHVVDRA